MNDWKASKELTAFVHYFKSLESSLTLQKIKIKMKRHHKLNGCNEHVIMIYKEKQHLGQIRSVNCAVKTGHGDIDLGSSDGVGKEFNDAMGSYRLQ